ncbi:MAG: ABC transporter substrate-binding protein [Desulfarculaceae bacterium]
MEEIDMPSFKRTVMIVFGVAVLTLAASGLYAADLTIGTRPEPAIDPHFFYVDSNLAYSEHIFGTLVRNDPNARKIPDLATSWKALDDTIWEFKLRKGVKFHDGSDFTAEDVVFSVNRIPKVPNNPNPYTMNTRSIESMKVLDPYTIRFKTKGPNPLLPARLVDVVIVSKKVAQNATTADFQSGKAAIGTGPYKFVKYISGDRLVLKRNENYYGKKPVWKNVTFKIISNNAARMAALLGGDVDLVDYVPPIEVAHLKKDKKVHIWSRPSDRVIYLLPDIKRSKSPFVTDKDGKVLDKNPLQDLRVRKAISMAINRKAICERVMDGLAIPASQLVPKGWYSHSPNLKVEKYDPKGAKKLLAEAGYPNGFGLTIHGPSDRYVNDAKICQAVAQMLARIGLKMKVDTMPKAVYFPKCKAPNSEFSLQLVGWGTGTGESSGALTGVLHSYAKEKGMGQFNKGGYSNPKFDKLSEQAVVTVDAAKREKLLITAMDIAIGELGAIPLHEQFTIAASRKGIKYVARADERTLAMNATPE